jgi:hypothetical protein
MRHIARTNREANPPRAVRIIPAADRDEEMMGRLGFAPRKNDTDIDWAALTRG